MSDEPEQIAVEFEHREGWSQGQVSLPTGLRDKAEIDDGTFTVDFSASESLVSNPTFVRLVKAGNTPVAGVPDEQAQAVQQRLPGDGAADSTSNDTDGDSAEQGGETTTQTATGGLEDLSKSDLWSLVHDHTDAPDDEIPEWSPATKGGLAELVDEYGPDGDELDAAIAAVVSENEG